MDTIGEHRRLSEVSAAQLHPLCARADTARDRLLLPSVVSARSSSPSRAGLAHAVSRAEHPVAGGRAWRLARWPISIRCKSEQRVADRRCALFGLGRFINRFISVLPGIPRSWRCGIMQSSLAASGAVRRHVGDRGDPGAQRARQHRAWPSSAFRHVLRRHRDHLHRGAQQGRDTARRWSASRRRIRTRISRPWSQPGKGKADAVFTAFDAARGDVLMILDADLTMPPEQLPKFWSAIRVGQGRVHQRLAAGLYRWTTAPCASSTSSPTRPSRYLFSWLLNQRYTDTLCGTKVMRRTRLSAAQGRQGVLRRFRSVRRFRSDLRRVASSISNRSTCRSATPRAAMAKRRSRASPTAGCCCGWWCSRSSGSRRSERLEALKATAKLAQAAARGLWRHSTAPLGRARRSVGGIAI